MKHLNDKIGTIFADGYEYLSSGADKKKMLHMFSSMKKSIKKLIESEKSSDVLSRIETKLNSATACKFIVGKQLKRMEHDWEIKYGWDLLDTSNKIICSSVWGGFDTMSAALEDLEKNIK